MKRRVNRPLRLIIILGPEKKSAPAPSPGQRGIHPEDGVFIRKHTSRITTDPDTSPSKVLRSKSSKGQRKRTRTRVTTSRNKYIQTPSSQDTHKTLLTDGRQSAGSVTLCPEQVTLTFHTKSYDLDCGR